MEPSHLLEQFAAGSARDGVARQHKRNVGPGVLTGGVIERHADEEVAAARSQREPEIVVPRDGRVRERERHRVRLRGRRPRADQERHAEPPRRPPAHDVTLAKGGGTAQGQSRCAGWTATASPRPRR